MNKPLTTEERETIIDWCILFTGYHRNYFTSLSDDELQARYNVYNKKQISSER